MGQKKEASIVGPGIRYQMTGRTGGFCTDHIAGLYDDDASSYTGSAPEMVFITFFPDLAPKFISSSSTTILNSMALKTNLDEIYVY